MEKVFSAISTAFSALWTVAELIFSNIANIVTTVQGVFRGFLDFIVGVFTGDWKKAWGGIKTIFTSVLDGISKGN